MTAQLKKELSKEAKSLNMTLDKYIELLLSTHQDRVQKFVSIIRPLK